MKDVISAKLGDIYLLLNLEVGHNFADKKKDAPYALLNLKSEAILPDICTVKIRVLSPLVYNPLKMATNFCIIASVIHELLQ